MQKVPTKIEINQVSDRIGNNKDNSYSRLEIPVGILKEFLKECYVVWKIPTG